MVATCFANAIAQNGSVLARSGVQQVRTPAGLGIHLRRIRVDPAVEIENGLPIAIGGGIGPVVHAVGAHASREIEHAAHRVLHLGVGRLEQGCAGALGRLEPRAADPEMLQADLRNRSAAVGSGNCATPWERMQREKASPPFCPADPACRLMEVLLCVAVVPSRAT